MHYRLRAIKTAVSSDGGTVSVAIVPINVIVIAMYPL